MHLLRRFDLRSAIQYQDRDLTALLVILGVTIFIVSPLVAGAWVGSELMLVMFALVTIVGVGAVSDHPAGVWGPDSVAVASVALDWAARHEPTPRLVTIDLVVRLAFTLLLGLVVTVRVFRSGSVTHHRIQGAIVVYLLSGLAWGYVYEIIDVLDSAAFHFAASPGTSMTRMGLFRYFSFETLTTLGYGDVLPVRPIARSLTTLQALFGQQYPAVVVARLVTMELTERRVAAQTPEGPARKMRPGRGGQPDIDVMDEPFPLVVSVSGRSRPPERSVPRTFGVRHLGDSD
jgi:hypothetical protein